ncbi:hypothetical protein LTX96_0000275 [Nakaseomyces glabratus]|nr:hypothetical protein LTX96_0000275 [Nakaseomyces glabratus]
MEQRLETEDLHSESTDISSSIDADDLLHSGDSSLGEADKQIMEWAGKLELESIDLREKSEKLINTLTNMSQELMKVSSQLVKQLENCNHSKEEGMYRLKKKKTHFAITTYFFYWLFFS